MTEVYKVIHFLLLWSCGNYYSSLDSSSPCILQTAASKKWLKTTSRLRSSSGAHGKYSPHYSKFCQFCPDGPPYIGQKMKAPQSCFEAIKLIVRHGPLYTSACRKRTVWSNWCSSLPWLSPCLHHHHHHRVPSGACTNQISRASNGAALEGSKRSLPKLASSRHIHWCENIVHNMNSLGFDQKRGWQFGLILSGIPLSVFKGIGRPLGDLDLPAGGLTSVKPRIRRFCQRRSVCCSKLWTANKRWKASLQSSLPS